MTQIFNFSAGPAVLPKEVLQQAAAEMLDWHGSGMSVMEMSHRGPEFISIYQQAVADLRELLAVPANYRILFQQGGGLGQNAIIPMNLVGRKTQPATVDFVHTGSWSGKSIKEAQRYANVNVAASSEANGFTAVPMNLLRGKKVFDVVNTGEWSKKVIAEGRKYAEVNVVASSEDRNFTYVPRPNTWKRSADAAYLHICSNETIGGVEYHFTPDTGETPLVADMSSHILSRPLDVTRYGLIYAGAQKNIGPAGLVLVIVREDLLGGAMKETPDVVNYAIQAKSDSMLNTPPTFSLYLAGLTFKWLLERGGLGGIELTNVKKAGILYDYLDSQDFYSNAVAKEDRSRMNVPFKLRDASLDAKFLAEAEARGLSQLKGHRSVGGMRASIYNAMPVEGVEALVAFMEEFRKKNA